MATCESENIRGWETVALFVSYLWHVYVASTNYYLYYIVCVHVCVAKSGCLPCSCLPSVEAPGVCEECNRLLLGKAVSFCLEFCKH